MQFPFACAETPVRWIIACPTCTIGWWAFTEQMLGDRQRVSDTSLGLERCPDSKLTFHPTNRMARQVPRLQGR